QGAEGGLEVLTGMERAALGISREELVVVNAETEEMEVSSKIDGFAFVEIVEEEGVRRGAVRRRGNGAFAFQEKRRPLLSCLRWRNIRRRPAVRGRSRRGWAFHSCRRRCCRRRRDRVASWCLFRRRWRHRR